MSAQGRKIAKLEARIRKAEIKLAEKRWELNTIFASIEAERTKAAQRRHTEQRKAWLLAQADRITR